MAVSGSTRGEVEENSSTCCFVKLGLSCDLNIAHLLKFYIFLCFFPFHLEICHLGFL